MMPGGAAGLESEPTVKTNKQTNKQNKQKKQTKNQTNKRKLISVNEPPSARDLDNLR